MKELSTWKLSPGPGVLRCCAWQVPAAPWAPFSEDTVQGLGLRVQRSLVSVLSKLEELGCFRDPQESGTLNPGLRKKAAHRDVKKAKPGPKS